MKLFIDKAGEVIDLASKVASAVGGIVGKIPGLQGGGLAEKGRAYVVGEHGPELFVPGVTGTVIPNWAEPKSLNMGMGAASSGGGSAVVNVYVSGSVTSERDLVQSIRNALIQDGRRNGGNILGGYA